MVPLLSVGLDRVMGDAHLRSVQIEEEVLAVCQCEKVSKRGVTRADSQIERRLSDQ